MTSMGCRMARLEGSAGGAGRRTWMHGVEVGANRGGLEGGLGEGMTVAGGGPGTSVGRGAG